MNINNIRLKLLFGGVIIILIVFVAIILYLRNKTAPTVPLTITGSVPAENATAVDVFSPITVTFNQDVNPESLSVSSDPIEAWDVTRISTNSVKLDHKLYLRVATRYRINILNDGNVVGSLSFETAHDQNDPRQLQNLKSQLNEGYPLASYTPYQTPNFRVVYSAPLTLEIDLTTSLSPQDAISQVQLWVRSHGIDPSTHKYNVIATTPTPQP